MSAKDLKIFSDHEYFSIMDDNREEKRMSKQITSKL